MVTVSYTEQKTSTGKDLEEDFSVALQQIIDEIEKNNNITQKELSKKIGINEKNIRNNIAKLKKLEFLQRIGPDKGGYWKVLMGGKIKNVIEPQKH